MDRSEALAALRRDAHLPGFTLQEVPRGTHPAGEHGWSAFLPGRALIYPGPTDWSCAHELAHVVVAGAQGVVRPEAPAQPAHAQRALWLLFNAVADVFVDAELMARQLLAPGHARRAAGTWARLAEAAGDEFCGARLRPFYQEHAAELQRDAQAYAPWRSQSGGLRPLFEALAARHLPDVAWTWLLLDDLRASGSRVVGQAAAAHPPDPAEDAQALSRLLGALLRGPEPFGLLLWDVAALRDVNREHGRATGDRALAALSAALGGGLGARHFRHGGDEGLVVLPGARPEDRDALLARALLAAERYGGVGVPLTVRLGLAFSPHDGQTLPDLFARLHARAFAGTLNL